MNRFQDEQRQSITEFRNKFLVRCPRCNSCATIVPANPEYLVLFANVKAKFSCVSCGASKYDYYMRYHLWLQASCWDRILWAYNLEHLDFIERFVSAKLREQRHHELYGWSNSSLFSRLPKWMQSKKNREEILKTIEKMRKTLC
ncbi:MAG: hypothetical protein ACRC11_04735 [Xenococcaceae cyanobacterium]